MLACAVRAGVIPNAEEALPGGGGESGALGLCSGRLEGTFEKGVTDTGTRIGSGLEGGVTFTEEGGVVGAMWAAGVVLT